MMDFTPIKFKSALVSAAVCCPLEAADNLPSVLQYLKAVLDTVLDGTDIHANVAPVPYPPCSKQPVVITLTGQEPRLLWYCKGMPALALADELYWLLSDLPLISGRIPA